jgi:hypothetical protein
MAPGPDMPSRRDTRSKERRERYGVFDTYKGYDLSRMSSGAKGDIIRVVDGLMPLSPDFDTITEAKKYIDNNL